MFKKAIIIGPPFSGKTTLVELFSIKHPELKLKELDEMLIEMNSGSWPEDEKIQK